MPTISGIYFGFISLFFLCLGRAEANRYHLKDSFVGEEFFKSWNWETFQDPTHGRVNYVDQKAAIAKNLSFVQDNQFFMKADDYSMVDIDSRGRDSIRIRSKDAYETALMVLDLSHMPEGCGTWPAWWTLSAKGPWPIGGEIDIIEGVNLNDRNAATLHTSAGCAMAEPRNQKGTVTSENCDVAANSNQGCGTRFAADDSYGSNFNKRGGGWFVLQRDARSGINVWFWPRGDPSVPHELRWASPDLSVEGGWGQPEASFTYGGCDYPSHFDAHQMIFDLTFCGDWAGATFVGSGCPMVSCDEYVDRNPEKFREAYWAINSLRVYTPGGDWDDGDSSHQSPPSSDSPWGYSFNLVRRAIAKVFQ